MQQEKSSKAGKVHCCCLNSSQPTFQVSWLKRVLALLCNASALPTHLLVPVLLGCTASRRCLQPFWLGGARRHSPQWLELRLSSFAWAREGEDTLGYSQFPKQVLQLGGPRNYLHPWIWINPPACSNHRTLHPWYWLCSGSNELCLSSLSLSRALPHSFQFSPVLWSYGAKRHSPQWVGLWFSSLPGCGDTRL